MRPPSAARPGNSVWLQPDVDRPHPRVAAQVGDVPDMATSPFSMTRQWLVASKVSLAFCSTSSRLRPSSRSRCRTSQDVLDELGRQAHRRLVQQQQLRPGHQRPADGQHLLLAAGQRAGQPAAHLAAAPGRARRPRPGRARVSAVPAAGVRAEQQVLLHRQARRRRAGPPGRSRCRAAPCRGPATRRRSVSPNRIAAAARGTRPISALQRRGLARRRWRRSGRPTGPARR